MAFKNWLADNWESIYRPIDKALQMLACSLAIIWAGAAVAFVLCCVSLAFDFDVLNYINLILWSHCLASILIFMTAILGTAWDKLNDHITSDIDYHNAGVRYENRHYEINTMFDYQTEESTDWIRNGF